MPKLIHAIFVKDEAHCINNMLDTVLPFVDESYIMIDDRTTDNTKELVEARGCNTMLFKFNNFAKTKNTLLNWVNDKTDWLIGIAPDETISDGFGLMLRELIDKIHNTDIDCVRFPRRHWEDLAMNKEYTEKKWYPDLQSRLLRADFPRIHLVRYVHEIVKGNRKTIEDMRFDINHFNLYWKSIVKYDWGKMNKLYEELRIRNQKENGSDIWPD